MTDQQDGAPDFAVTVSHEGAARLVSFAGSLDVATAQSMRSVFVQPEVINAPVVQVDLTQATFLDTSAVGVLVAACRRVRSGGRTFFVTFRDGLVRRVLEVSGLLDYLQVEDASQPSR